MGVIIEELTCVDCEWWNGLVAGAPHGTVYQTTYWADYFQRYYRAHPYFLVARIAGAVAGLLLLFRMGRFPDRDAIRPWLYQAKRPLNALWPVFRWYYGPVVLEPWRSDDVLIALLHEVEELARREGVCALEHGSAPARRGGPRSSSRETLGFLASEGGTFLIDLSTTVDTLWAGLKPTSARSTVARAMRLGLRAYDATEDPIDAHVSCEYQHSRAHGIQAWPRDWFIANRAAFAGVGAYRVFAAEYEGRPVAFTPVLVFNRTMHLLKPVQLPECRERRIPAGDFLMWNVIVFGHEQKLETFDLAGVAPVPSTAAEKGIWFFKSKWGGNYMSFPVLRKRFRWRRLP